MEAIIDFCQQLIIHEISKSELNVIGNMRIETNSQVIGNRQHPFALSHRTQAIIDYFSYTMAVHTFFIME